jgi:L-aminopeptidase/D-esterase-like protein
MSDGDTVFALGTGLAALSGPAPGMMVLATMAAEAVARAVLQAVWAAEALQVGTLQLPAARDFAPVAA